MPVRRSLGIRYAVPPTGTRRWRPPEPLGLSEGTGAFGPAAPQRTTGPLVEGVPGMVVEGEQSEDCLFLNVWAPEDAAGLPVVVWVHGGAFVIGSGSLPTYDGTRLAEHGVVVVSINYRLGALGFLCAPDGDFTPNAGLLDIVAALGWVRQHIERFGGDPSRISVVGESAGAGCIRHLLHRPEAAGVFDRAILMSPGADRPTREDGEAMAEAFLRHAGAGIDDLRELPVDRILDAQDATAVEMAGRMGAMPWCPVFLEDAALHPVDAVLGTTAEELRPYAPDDLELGSKMTWVMMRKPLEAFAADLRAVGAGVWTYTFDWPAPVVGAAHATDLPFVFGTFDVDGWDAFLGATGERRADAERVSGDLMASWVAFATTGDPSNERTGPWAANMVLA